MGNISLPDGYLCEDDNPWSSGDRCLGGNCTEKAAPKMAGSSRPSYADCGQEVTCQPP